MQNNRAIIEEIDRLFEWCVAKNKNRMSNKSLTKLEQQGYRDAMFAILYHLEKRKEELYIVKKCTQCGNIFTTPNQNAKLCDDCTYAVQKEAARKNIKKQKLWKVGNKAYSEKQNKKGKGKEKC